MKQVVFMIIATTIGTLGVVVRPFWGAAVYYLFATLRPQYLWQWVPLPEFQWSRCVALATIGGTFAASLGLIPLEPRGVPRIRRVFGLSHAVMALFACWISLTYFTARSQVQAYDYFIEYIKIFAIMTACSFLLATVNDLYKLLIVAIGALSYISYEVNALYLSTGYVGIAKNGYGGLDNNGAALMLAMGVPVCVVLWDCIQGPWRWFSLALVPVIVHAVLMTYSRGAMLSLLVTSPLLLIRGRHRVQLATIGAIFFVGAIPVLAGPEIKERFLTLKRNDVDESANLRRASWAAAWRMAKDNPIFGVGIRNSNLYSFQYGADREGRTIHSQYLQIAADNGLVGLGLYVAMMGSVWLDTQYCRRAVKGKNDPQSRKIHAVAVGVETSLAVFCFGGAFLSLENFELPYLMVLLGAQLGALVRGQVAQAPKSIPGM
jgi:probable O-glycosylation ligase (exosortase A-associated)